MNDWTDVNTEKLGYQVSYAASAPSFWKHHKYYPIIYTAELKKMIDVFQAMIIMVHANSM